MASCHEETIKVSDQDRDNIRTAVLEMIIMLLEHGIKDQLQLSGLEAHEENIGSMQVIHRSRRHQCSGQ